MVLAANTVIGHVQCLLDGKLVAETHNLFVNSGYQGLANILGHAPGTPLDLPSCIELGSTGEPTIGPASAALTYVLGRQACQTIAPLGTTTARCSASWTATVAQGAIQTIALCSPVAGAPVACTVSAGSSTTVLVVTDTLIPNQFNGYLVQATGGAQTGEYRRVLSNDAHSLTISVALPLAPTAGNILGVFAESRTWALSSVGLTKGIQQLVVIWQLQFPH